MWVLLAAVKFHVSLPTKSVIPRRARDRLQHGRKSEKTVSARIIAALNGISLTSRRSAAHRRWANSFNQHFAASKALIASFRRDSARRSYRSNAGSLLNLLSNCSEFIRPLEF